MPYTLEDAEALKAELAAMPDADNKKKALTKRGTVAVLSENCCECSRGKATRRKS